MNLISEIVETVREGVGDEELLRARDEAAKAVVRWWQANRHREAAVGEVPTRRGDARRMLEEAPAVVIEARGYRVER